MLEGDKSRGAFSGATHTAVSEIFPQSTVKICALYYISYLFYEKYDHAQMELFCATKTTKKTVRLTQMKL